MLPSDFTHAMSGIFAGLDDIHPSPWADAEIASVRVSGTAELSGGLLVQRWREVRAAQEFEVLHVFMAAPGDGDLLLYSYDTLGFPADPPARGRWQDGHVELLRQTDRGQACTIFTRTDEGFRWSKTYRSAADQPWTPVVTGVFTREKETAR